MKYPSVMVYLSSRNNYDMLKHEVFRAFDTANLHFVNVDDFSDEAEQAKGKAICKSQGVVYIPNKKRGLQYAAQTAMEYARTNWPGVKFMIHFQHDVVPIDHDKFFSQANERSESGFFDQFGAVGFNSLDIDGRNTKKLYDKFRKGNQKVVGITGVACLSRCPSTYYNGAKWDMPWKIWGRPFAVDSTAWFCVGFSIANFEKHIQVTDEYHLQLWGGDINLQYLKNNIFNIAVPDMYVANHMKLKEKYGMHSNSAKGGKGGDEKHFGHYGPHFEVFKKRWGWDWEQKREFAKVASRYKGTLLDRFYGFDVSKGPLKTWSIT